MIRTPKSSPHDRVTTYVCTDRKRRAEVERVRGALSDDLRKPEYQGNPNPVAGHCYVASEALYHRLGGKAAGWTPQSIRHEGGRIGISKIWTERFSTPPPTSLRRPCHTLRAKAADSSPVNPRPGPSTCWIAWPDAGLKVVLRLQ